MRGRGRIYGRRHFKNRNKSAAVARAGLADFERSAPRGGLPAQRVGDREDYLILPLLEAAELYLARDIDSVPGERDAVCDWFTISRFFTRGRDAVLHLQCRLVCG